MTATSSEFVTKLFVMLEEPENYPYISWSRDGKSFVISNQEGFSEFVLEKHFRHKNWSSFVRQLNKYDFCKVRSDEGARTGYEALLWEYRNRYFLRGRPDLLHKIKRKRAPSERAVSCADPHLKKIESSVVYQAHVLNAVKEISRYLQAVTEDINEIKRYIHQERRRTQESRMSVLVVQEMLVDLSYICGILELQNCSLTTVEDNENINNTTIVHEKQDLVVLYAVSAYCSATIRKIRSSDISVPIILIIDKGFRDRYVGTLGIGATDVLLMPFSREDLIGLINKYRAVRI